MTVDGLRARPVWVDRVAVFVALIVGWHLLAVTVLDGSRVVPTPFEVALQIWDDRGSIRANAGTTLREALIGYAIGNLVAIALGLLFDLVPALEGPLLRVAIAAFNIPLVALAPILVVTLSGDGPKAALAALSVFFTTLIAMLLGLKSADATALALVRAAGGGRTAQLRKVKLWFALPSLLGGLRIAAPAALLGTVIGEYLGASEGLGVAMIQAQSSFEVARTWGLALVVSALAGVLYLGAGILGRILTPWAATVDVSTGGARNVPPAAAWLRTARAIGTVILTVGLLLGVWWGLLRWLDLNPFFAKRPDDVYRYLFTVPRAAANRTTLADALRQTLVDAAAGFAIGTAAATLAAILTTLSPVLDQAVMPVAIALRSVPLVALTPLIALLFGRGFWGVTAVVGLVVFFPTLVNVAVGLRSAPRLARDVVAVSGGDKGMVLRKAQLPYALPALFASARIAAPAAIGGATLAEWLATGKGLGSVLVVSYSGSNFSLLWSGAAALVTVSILLYGAVGALEGAVVARFGVAVGRE